MAGNWYRTGTVALTNGSNAVVGTGTLWVTNGIAIGDVLTADNVTLYEVQSVTAEGALTLDRPYAGTTVSGAAYAIIRNFSPLAASLMTSINNLITAYTTGTQPYELDKYFSGSPSASQVVYERIFAITVTLPANLVGSLGKAGTAATASATFNIQKNGTTIGTITFGASATVPTFTLSGAVTFLAGDILTIVAPASPDATLANIALVLLGSIA